MYNHTYCKWLLMACLLGSAAIGCAPGEIAAPPARAPRAAAVEPPSSRAGGRLDRPTRSADEPAPDDPARAEPAAGERASAEPPDTGEGDAPDTGEGDAPDTGEAVLFPAAQVDVQSNSARVAFEFFVSRGLTREQAAGIVGNLMQESGVNPAARQSDGPGRGIAQWSAGGRWNNLLRFAKARRASPLGLTTQLQFLWHELTTVPAYGLGALRAARSVVSATRVFEKSFEVCGACNEPRRIALAQAALRAYGHRAARRRA